MIGIIGGTGLSSFHQGEAAGNRLTPYGETSATMIRSEIDGTSVLFLARHGEPHSIPPHRVNYRANIWAFKQLGVSKLVAVNAVGGISAEMPAGSLVIPDQIVDYSYGRDHTFYDGDNDQLEHIDFSFPFSTELRQSLVAAAAASYIDIIDGATLGVTQGPRLESAAEINRMDSDGCELVGMTAMPEAALARELGIDYASICLVVNPAAGRSDSLITMEQINDVIQFGMTDVRRLLMAAIANL
ncbi:MAG: S-methyl-5'-thioinosine phosphorylase [Oceanicoccus sp.]